MWEKRFFLNDGAKERESALSLSAEKEKVTDFVRWAEGARGLEGSGEPVRVGTARQSRLATD